LWVAAQGLRLSASPGVTVARCFLPPLSCVGLCHLGHAQVRDHQLELGHLEHLGTGLLGEAAA